MKVFATLERLIPQYRFSFRNERIFQDEFSMMLRSEGIPFQREFSLSPGERPDFMIDSVAVDLKVGGSINSHLRQLKRYADHESVSAIALVATRPFSVPATLSNKPCACFCIRML